MASISQKLLKIKYIFNSIRKLHFTLLSIHKQSSSKLHKQNYLSEVENQQGSDIKPKYYLPEFQFKIQLNVFIIFFNVEIIVIQGKKKKRYTPSFKPIAVHYFTISKS